jgi:hypothetical protein
MLIVFRSHNVDQNLLSPFLLTFTSVQVLITRLHIFFFILLFREEQALTTLKLSFTSVQYVHTF